MNGSLWEDHLTIAPKGSSTSIHTSQFHDVNWTLPQYIKWKKELGWSLSSVSIPDTCLKYPCTHLTLSSTLQYNSGCSKLYIQF
jgi:hypothetical protein